MHFWVKKGTSLQFQLLLISNISLVLNNYVFNTLKIRNDMKYLFKNYTLNYLTHFIHYYFLNIFLTTMYFPNNYFFKIKINRQISLHLHHLPSNYFKINFITITCK